MTPGEAYERALRLYMAAEPESGLQLTVPLVRALRDHPQVRMLHGSLLRAAGRTVEAQAALEKALELLEAAGPDAEDRKGATVRTLTELALARSELGLHESALESADRAIATDEMSAGAHAARATVLLDAGRADEAAKAIGPWLLGDATEPHPAAAGARIALESDALKPGAMLEHIEPLVKQVGHSKRDLIMMLRAVGLLLDATGRHDDAFVSFRRATNLIVSKFDVREFAALVTRTTTEWETEAMSKVSRPEPSGPTPVLVVGLTGAPTDAVGRVLRAAEGAGWGGRSWIMVQLAMRFFDAEQRGGIAYLASPTTVRGKTCATAAEVAGKRFAERVLDEDPRAVADTNPVNAGMLGLASLCLPGMRVIRVRTNPVRASLDAYCLHAGHDTPQACDFAQISGYAYGTSRMLDHWHKVITDERLGVEWLDVDAATLTEDPEAFARTVVEFAGAGWTDACAEVARREARRPSLDPSAYERHTQTLTRGLGPLAASGKPV